MLKNWMIDAGYAARRLRTRPGYTVVAVLTLALGIGGTAAGFGIARPLLFEPLPYRDAEELGAFWMPFDWTEEEFLHLRGKIPGFSAVASYRPEDVTLRVGDSPARLIPGIASSAELFDVLGTAPALGRGFQAGEDLPGAEPVVVLSHGLWRGLGGDRSILGTRLTLDGTPRTVIGVMPPGFWFPSPAVRAWVPVQLSPERRSGNYALVGRVARGGSIDVMEGPLGRLTAMLRERFRYMPQWDKTRDPRITPFREYLVGSMRPALVATFAAMGLILLIACANVAALMLGQVEGRAAELAVRSALGASRGRLTQQLVVEALLVGGVAGAAGAGLATVAFRMLVGALPLGAWGESAALDWPVFVAAMVLATGAALLVVLVPTMSLWRGDLRQALARGRTSGIQGRGGHLERGLVVAEVALAMLIASGAALLIRSVKNLYAIDPGLETKGIAVLDVVMPANDPIARRKQTINELLTGLRQLPGVRSVAVTHRLPLRGGGSSTGMLVEGRPDQQLTTTFYRIVSPDYFETLGIRVRDGRGFTEADLVADTSAQVIVINEALARKYFPGENPIGRRVATGFGGWAEVVGVVGDVPEGRLTAPPEPARYSPYPQHPFTYEGQTLVLRTREPDPAGLLDLARQTVERTSPGTAVQEATTMERVFDAAVGPARQVMSLLGLLSSLALVLGAVGIYGVMSHFAARRKREWAIRVALGFPGSRVVRHIVRQGVALVGIGIVFGAIGTLALGRVLVSFLFGVSTLDPLALAAAAAALLTVGVAASLAPARRAGTVDPARVLREE